jgi:hypothetical protein
MTTLLTLERLHDLRNDRQARHSLARTLYRNVLAEEFYVTSPRDVLHAIRQVKQEPNVYAMLLDEEMPAHLRGALDLEEALWTYVHGLLTAAPISEDRYAQLCARLTPFARVLDDLLHHEEAMLTNPLVAHYESITRRLRGIANTAIPDFDAR